MGDQLLYQYIFRYLIFISLSIMILIIYFQAAKLFVKPLMFFSKWSMKSANREDDRSKFTFYNSYSKDELIREIRTLYLNLEGIKEISKDDINALLIVLQKNKITIKEYYAIKRFKLVLSSISRYSHLSGTISLNVSLIGGFLLNSILINFIKNLSQYTFSVIFGIVNILLMGLFFRFVYSTNQRIENNRRKISVITGLIDFYIDEFTITDK